MMPMDMRDRQGRLGSRHSITDARRNLPALVRDEENGDLVELTRRGKLVAVLLGLSQFERLISGQRTFEQAYRAFCESVDLRALQIDPDEVFGDI